MDRTAHKNHKPPRLITFFHIFLAIFTELVNEHKAPPLAFSPVFLLPSPNGKTIDWCLSGNEDVGKYPGDDEGENRPQGNFDQALTIFPPLPAS